MDTEGAAGHGKTEHGRQVLSRLKAAIGSPLRRSAAHQEALWTEIQNILR
jgi:hypothetical protein